MPCQYVNAIHLKECDQTSCVFFFQSSELKVVDAIYWESKDSSDQIYSSALIQSLSVKWDDDVVQSKAAGTPLNVKVDRLTFQSNTAI